MTKKKTNNSLSQTTKNESTNSMKPKFDLYQKITSQIIAGMESAESWTMPWHGENSSPINVASGKAYKGINVLELWVAGYKSSVWGTYKQWAAKGAQVKKGEKSTMAVFYKKLEDKVDDDGVKRPMFVARAFNVFNLEQVDGMKEEELPNLAQLDVELEHFAENTGAEICSEEARAYYNPLRDFVNMPGMERFKGEDEEEATSAYYSTLMHELVHWTGHKDRCDRDLKNRFGDDGYAMEELVAELGAAFLCSRLGISSEPRQDHASYLASWLKILKGDKKAIFTAASRASKAADYLMELQAKENTLAA